MKKWLRLISEDKVFNSLTNLKRGSDCGSVGRAVASNSRGPQFKSSHWQHFKFNIYCQLYLKNENKEKEAGNGALKKTNLNSIYFLLSVQKKFIK